MLLVAGCEQRDPILVKSEMDGSALALQKLPGVKGTSGSGTTGLDEFNNSLEKQANAGGTVDPFSLPGIATPEGVSPQVPDWQRLSVLSLGLESRNGDYDFARLSTEESKRPTPHQVELEAGRVALYSGQFSKALEHLESAKKSDPSDFRAYFYEAVVNLQSKDEAAKARAKAGIDFAISLAPRETELYLHRGNLRLGEGDYGPAVDDFTRVLQAHPQHLGALMNRTVANFHRRRPKDMVDDATTLLTLKPGIADAHLLRALGWLMQGESVRGKRDFDAAVAAGLSQPAIEAWKRYFYPKT